MGLEKQKIGLPSATSFVIANMIGTGVFTSLGFQLFGTTNLFAVIMLWVVGAIIALSGALVYGELGAAMPRSGGEYHYLSKIYHPAVGFLSGFVSMTIGFAAPVALASMAFGSYGARVLPADPTVLALIVLVVITAIHCIGTTIGVRFQNGATLIKIILILVFIGCGFVITGSRIDASFVPSAASIKDMINPSFAVSLIYVSYAYSGWNAAAYIAGEMDNPRKKLPLALLAGTLIVAALYVLLNYTFLLTAPVSELKGQIDVGYVSAHHIFGTVGGTIMGSMIALLLVSSVSSMVFVGPRVTQVIGEDLRLFSVFSKRTKGGTPVYAILFQSAISFVLVLTHSFDTVLTYVGFTLNIFTFLAVLGVFVHRFRFKSAERPYKTWGYPFVPIIYLALVSWTLIFLIKERPVPSMSGLLTVAVGLAIYGANRLVSPEPNAEKTAS